MLGPSNLEYVMVRTLRMQEFLERMHMQAPGAVLPLSKHLALQWRVCILDIHEKSMNMKKTHFFEILVATMYKHTAFHNVFCSINSLRASSNI